MNFSIQQGESKNIKNYNIDQLAKSIASNLPNLGDLTDEQLKDLTRAVVSQKLVKKLDDKVNIAMIDFELEKELFFEIASKTNSVHTIKAYKNGLSKLEAYTKENNLTLLGLSKKNVDDFIYWLNQGKSSPRTTRLAVASCSSFFNFLERRHESFENTFRGTRARPVNRAVKKMKVPTSKEVIEILKYAKQESINLFLAILIMATNGLRIGALHTLEICETGKYKGVSKGKPIKGKFNSEIMSYIKGSTNPFAYDNESDIRRRVSRFIVKLYGQGVVQNPYSCHDFRHYFATTFYKNNKDVYKLKRLLNHASISVTDTYLRSLDLID